MKIKLPSHSNRASEVQSIIWGDFNLTQNGQMFLYNGKTECENSNIYSTSNRDKREKREEEGAEDISCNLWRESQGISRYSIKKGVCVTREGKCSIKTTP